MKKLFLIAGCLFMLGACAGTSDSEIVAQQPLTEIYKNAYAEFNDENYDVAAAEFQKAESQDCRMSVRDCCRAG